MVRKRSKALDTIGNHNTKVESVLEEGATALSEKNIVFVLRVSNTCRTSYMFLRCIAAIRHLLTTTTSAAEQLIHAFITSRLDFCNSLLAGLPQNTLHRI